MEERKCQNSEIVPTETGSGLTQGAMNCATTNRKENLKNEDC